MSSDSHPPGYRYSHYLYDSHQAFTRHATHTAEADEHYRYASDEYDTEWLLKHGLPIGRWRSLRGSSPRPITEVPITDMPATFADFAVERANKPAPEYPRGREHYSQPTLPSNANTKVNLGFRPRTYWPNSFFGLVRRRPRLTEDMLFEILCGNGAYLPELLEGEVEIARLRYPYTVHREVTSIRARRIKRKIHYRVVSELVENGEIACGRETSDKPLTLAELIDLIESSDDFDGQRYGLYFGDLHWRLQFPHLVSGPDELNGFIEVSSSFYPEIGQWYVEACDEWCERELAARREEESEESNDDGWNADCEDRDNRST